MHTDGALAYAQWLHEAGRFDEAAEAYRGILKRDRTNPQALRGMALVLAARGDYAKAAAHLARIGNAGMGPEYQLELAQLSFLAAEYPAANKACEAYLRHRPDDPTALCLRASLREQRGDFQGAVTAYRDALRRAPDNPGILNNCGLALRAAGDYTAALDCYRHALRIAPDYAPAWNNLGNALRELQRETEALNAFEEASRLAPEAAATHFNRGLALQQLGRHVEAIASFEKALALEPGHDEAALQIAESRLSLGEFASATRQLELILARDPGHAGANYLLSTTHRFTTADRAAVARMEQARKRHAPGEEAQVRLDFALGKAYDDLGEFERAFGCFERGNRGQLQRLQTHARPAAEALEKLQRLDADCWRPRAELPAGLGKGLVFIVGMPRSGTTLVEQILASHPAAHGAGETGCFERALLRAGQTELSDGPALVVTQFSPAAIAELGREVAATLREDAQARTCFVDKTPGHFAWLGLIQRLYPDARVVHCRRHPLDTCLSIYFQLFSTGHPYAYDLRAIGQQYRAYASLMAHWRAVLESAWLDLSYEDVVRDPRAAAAGLLAHCGLEWDERCIEPHRTQRTVSTASRWQVRQPVHARATGRWQHYRARLGPLIEALGELPDPYADG